MDSGAAVFQAVIVTVRSGAEGVYIYFFKLKLYIKKIIAVGILGRPV